MKYAPMANCWYASRRRCCRWRSAISCSRPMLTLNTKIESAEKIDGELVLPYDQREKSRLRAKLESGEDVAVFAVRGTVLRNGDLLRGDDGRVVKITAARESTYRVECPTPRDLLRCAFHLG